MHLIPKMQRGSRQACLWAYGSWTEKSCDLVQGLQQVSTWPQKNKFWTEIPYSSPYWPKVTMTVTIYKQKMLKHFCRWEVKEKNRCIFVKQSLRLSSPFSLRLQCLPTWCATSILLAVEWCLNVRKKQNSGGISEFFFFFVFLTCMMANDDTLPFAALT